MLINLFAKTTLMLAAVSLVFLGGVGCTNPFYQKRIGFLPEPEHGWRGQRANDYERTPVAAVWIGPKETKREFRRTESIVGVNGTSISEPSFEWWPSITIGLGGPIGPSIDGLNISVTRIRFIAPCDQKVLDAQSAGKELFSIVDRSANIHEEMHRWAAEENRMYIPLPKNTYTARHGDIIDFSLQLGPELRAAEECTLDLSDAILLPSGEQIAPLTFRRKRYRD